jgi:Peptidase inhibitor family I36
MRTSHYLRVTTLIAVVLALIAALTPTPLADSDLQQQVDDYLAAHPGGIQINATDIVYDSGTFVVTVARPHNSIDGPDCPTGWFCFYSDPDYRGQRGKLQDCGWQDLARWGWQDKIESAHYNLPDGTVWFIDHTSSNHTDDKSLFDIGASRRARSNVTPYQNRADHVYRIC